MIKKKSRLETHHYFTIDIILLLERAYLDGSITIMKGWMMTSKKVSCAIKITTRKANKTKYHEVSMLLLDLIN